MSPYRIVAATVAIALSSVAPSATAPSKSATRLDHVLLWGKSIDDVTAVMAVKLGFQVRPGHDTSGVANRYIRFADTSFIELLGATSAAPEYDPGMKADREALAYRPGARSFGFRTAGLEQLRTTLRNRGLDVTEMFAGPDSSHPGWRLFAFDRQPLSSGSFFIDYRLGYAPDQWEPTNASDSKATREHPNGVRSLTAIWLVTKYPDEDRRELAKMGFGRAVVVRLPQVGAVGYCVPIGPTALLTLRPDGPGAAADMLASGTSRILGGSFLVADLGRAQRWVERGYERPLARYSGLWGAAVLAPTRDDLGILIEFHAGQGKPSSPCGGVTANVNRPRRGGL